jgi:hypothetical protein
MTRVGYRAPAGQTELLHALATLRGYAACWKQEAAELRAEIDLDIVRSGETEHAARLSRRASHLECCAAIVLGFTGTETPMPGDAAPPAGIPAPLIMAGLWALANNWRGQAQECEVSPGARQMLRDHAGALGELLKWAAQEVPGRAPR